MLARPRCHEHTGGAGLTNRGDGDTAKAIRLLILEESMRAQVGHIASALSIADIVAVLFDSVLHLPSIDDPNRDRFILSKGHAALALYAALHLKGIIGRDQLATFCTDGSLLGVHPEYELDGVEFSTGSLGHGLSLGAGVALGARLRGARTRAFVLLSDAELNEGSTWEAVMFAGHHRLSNLVAIVDDNGQQALGPARRILDLQPLDEKWRAFGWEPRTVDGHDRGQLRAALEGAGRDGERPVAVIARTVAGKGVSFMERRFEWHYLPLNAEQYRAAVREVEALR